MTVLQGRAVPVTGRLVPFHPDLLRTPGRDEEFRGRRVLRAHTFIALDDDGAPVAQIGGDVYEWTRWDPATEMVTAVDPRRTVGAASVVDPRRGNRGYGRAMLRAFVAAPELADGQQFVLGIEGDSAASLGAARGSGFRPLTTEPDAEDMPYLLLVR